MAQFGFFQYIRLKIIISLFRILVTWKAGQVARREIALLPRDVQKQRLQIPTRDPGRYLDADLYLPLNYEDGSPQKPLPVLVNWHGSGFVFPLLGTDAYFCAKVAHDTGVAALDVDYRKGPESPHPAPLQDVEDALRWVAAQKGRFDAARVAVSGFSAGGLLAMVAATALRERLASTGLTIPLALSIYGCVDLDADPAGKKVPHPVNPHPAWLMRVFNDCYVPDHAARREPDVSPTFADADAFPDTTAFITCECDVLRPEVEVLADRLTKAAAATADSKGKVVVYKVLEGMPHAFDKGPEVGTLAWKRREEAYALASTLVKDALHL